MRPNMVKEIRFDSLQLFRGLAALGVVFYHTAQKTNEYVSEIPVWINSVFECGFIGVDFFFVLSGFIILKAHIDDEKSAESLKNFCIKRFVRIFPPYWPVSIALLISYSFLYGFCRGAGGELSMLSSFFLLPDNVPPSLSVAWTLIHEVMFYLVFCLFFISNRIFFYFLICWIFFICASLSTTTINHFSPFVERFLNPINLEFLMGMGVAYFARKISNRYGIFIIFSSAVVLILLLCWPQSLEYRILFGVPFSGMVLGAVMMESKLSFTLPKWLVLIGDASYSIYLIHNPLVALTSRQLSRLSNFTSWNCGILVGVFSSVVIGILYHLTIEKPLVRVFRRLQGRRVLVNGKTL